MKTCFALFCMLLIFDSVTAQVPGYDHFADTENLRFAWDEGAISDEGLSVLKSDGEKYYAAIRDMLTDAPAHKIVVLIEGPAQKPDGSWAYPHVDSWGRLHLYRFGPTYHDYLGAYAHELVHAIRIGRMPHHDWFFEEGLAEFIALRIDDDLRGFPWYDFPVAVVAGQWLAEGSEIPLRTLRENHRAINLPCKAQSYSLRSAFFDWLGKTCGDDAVLGMAEQADSGAIEDYETFLGRDFDSLVANWRETLLAEYGAIEGVAEQAKRYRNDSPIQYGPVCDERGVIRR